MSDILTSHSSRTRDDRTDNDNLVEFLMKLTRFGIDQCLHFIHLTTNKQKLFESILTLDHKYQIYQDQHIQLNHLLMEIQTLQKKFYDTLLLIPSSDDQNKQLLFIKIQNYLSNFMEINLRFKAINLPLQESHTNPIDDSTQSTATLELLTRKCDRISMSTTDSSFNIPQITISSSFDLNDDINTPIDIGKSWKFSNIIHTRFEMSLIASNSHVIVCYNNRTHFLHFVLITGQFQGNFKWKYNPIIDILWCALIDRYIAVTCQAIYTIQYNQSKVSTSSPAIVNKVLDLEKFHMARIACNQNNILLYTSQRQSSTLEVYDRQFKREQICDSFISKQLPINSQSFCCTNTLVAFTENDNIPPCFPYVTSKKMSILLFDINTFELRFTIDLNDCLKIYTMKCLEQHNIFFALSDEKILWIIQIDHNETVQLAKKTFYTDQTEMCITNNRDLLLINVNAGHTIQLIKYRKIKP